MFLSIFFFLYSGVKDVLKKRLKNYYKRQRMAQCNRALTEDEVLKFDYLVVIDFEATCSETNDNFVHEIIEFPAVLVDAQGHVLVRLRVKQAIINKSITKFVFLQSFLSSIYLVSLYIEMRYNIWFSASNHPYF